MGSGPIASKVATERSIEQNMGASARSSRMDVFESGGAWTESGWQESRLGRKLFFGGTGKED